jgi:sugar-phosphatase
MIKAVIFDMDGLMIDSEPLWQKSEFKVFSSVGLELTPEMCQQTQGLKINEMVQYWYNRYPWKDSVTCKDVEQQIIEELAYNIRESGKLMPGVLEAIHLFDEKSLPLGIASSSPMKIIEQVVNTFDLKNNFDVLRSADSETYGKPHPAVYINTCSELNTSPEYSLALEDSFNGLLSAKCAKMNTIAIPDPEQFDQTKFDIADLKIRTLFDIDEFTIETLNAKQ